MKPTGCKYMRNLSVSQIYFIEKMKGSLKSQGVAAAWPLTATTCCRAAFISPGPAAEPG
jgi:hypothetical protein